MEREISALPKWKQKSYGVVTIKDLRRLMQETQEQAAKGAKTSSGGSQQSEIRMEFNFSMK